MLPPPWAFGRIFTHVRDTNVQAVSLRYRTHVTNQTFDCLIKVKTEFLNKSQETYNENEDIAVMMFDISHGYIR